MRPLVPIRLAAPFIGCRSVTSVYALIHKDPAFAQLWFRMQGRVVAFEDELQAYQERRAIDAKAFPAAPEPQPKRGRGRPRKQVVEAATFAAALSE